MRVLLAEHADTTTLNALIARSARGLSVGYYSAAQIESAVRWVFTVDNALVADGTYFKVVLGDATIGCGGWSRRAALFHAAPLNDVDDLPALDPATDAARIRAMFVAPEFARRGVGRRLLDAGLAAARAAGFTRAELMSTLPGVPLYSAYGFASGERKEITLPDGVPLPLVRMTCTIDEVLRASD